MTSLHPPVILTEAGAALIEEPVPDIAVSPQARLLVTALLLLLEGAACNRSPQQTVASSSVVPTGPLIFEEVSERLGLKFTHDSGSRGEFFMPEHIGSGGALFDYDKDGRLDIFLIQCGGPGSGARNQLFHQENDGTFKNASAGSGLDLEGIGMGAVAGDVNNDGWTDLFVTEYGQVRLFLNRGQGHFEEATAASGIEDTRWATAASFIDYDRDGWLDLVVGNYVDYNPTQKAFDAAGLPDFTGPQSFQATVSRLFHNRGPAAGPGHVAFEDVTIKSGLAKAQGKALGVFCADFNGDRWPDIFIADDGVPNRLYINQRDGTFRDEALMRGLAFNMMGSAAGNMGVGYGDANNDGLFDLFITHLFFEQHSLWVQGPQGLFQDQVAVLGLASSANHGTGFGTIMADFDLDGWNDLALLNGSIRRGSAHPGTPLPGLIPFWFPYAQHSQLFLNDAQGRFNDISSANAPFCEPLMVGRGLACGDLDNDGDVDLLAVCSGGPARLYRNIAPRRGHWLTVRALDPSVGGRDAIGAEILMQGGGRQWSRLVQPSFSYLVSNDPRVHLGLGPVQQIDAVRVLWPDGEEEQFPGGTVDRHLVLLKGTGTRHGSQLPAPQTAGNSTASSPKSGGTP